MKANSSKHKTIPTKRQPLLQGDMLAIFLFFAAGLISMMLYITEKTPFVVGSILLTILAVSICLVVRFVQGTSVRSVALAAVAVFVIAIGINEWPPEKLRDSPKSVVLTPVVVPEKPCDARLQMSNITFENSGTAIEVHGTPCLNLHNTRFIGNGVGIAIGRPEPLPKVPAYEVPRHLHRHAPGHTSHKLGTA